MANIISAGQLVAEISGRLETIILTFSSQIEALTGERDLLRNRVSELETQKQELFLKYQSEMISWRAMCSEYEAKMEALKENANELQIKLENGTGQAGSNVVTGNNASCARGRCKDEENEDDGKV